MDAINQLHKEMYEALAYREENGYNTGHFNRWISLCELVEKAFIEQQKEADQLTKQHLQLKNKYAALVRWINAIGESEQNIFLLPAEFYERRTITQQIKHFNNPWLLYEDGIEYLQQRAKRAYFNHAMNLITT